MILVIVSAFLLFFGVRLHYGLSRKMAQIDRYAKKIQRYRTNAGIAVFVSIALSGVLLRMEFGLGVGGAIWLLLLSVAYCLYILLLPLLHQSRNHAGK